MALNHLQEPRDIEITHRTLHRMRRERQPTRVSYKIVTRFSYGKKKVDEIIHAEICPEIIKAEGYDVWTPCHRYHFVERYRSSKVMFFSKKVFHKTQFTFVYCSFKESKA